MILGCTHYPLVRPMLQRILGRDVRLVTAGHALAASAQRILEAQRPGDRDGEEGDYRFLCTGDPDVVPRARHPLPADAARRGRAGRACLRRRGVPLASMMAILEQCQADPRRRRTAMKARRARPGQRRCGWSRRAPAGRQGSAAATRSRCCTASASAGSRPPRPIATAAASDRAARRRPRRELIERYLPAAALRRRSSRRSSTRRSPRPAPRSRGDMGKVMAARDAEGRRARRRQAGQRGGAGAARGDGAWRAGS